ncbi:MAG: hypothetical protein AB7N24_11760 [Dehalococcoidia bacterium]
MKRIELLWFEGCPNHPAARAMIDDVVAEYRVRADVRAIEVADETIARRIRFPGSPTIRVDGVDIEPGFTDCDDCTPRCRVYHTSAGLRGLPERSWLVAALAADGRKAG